jgi:RNA polymerase sigma-70 factor, ECF subfamily
VGAEAKVADGGGEDQPGWATDPDVELMLRVRDGDTTAFRQLFARHADPVVNFATRFVTNRDRAEELVQDAFFQIFRARKRYEPRARFATFLYRVVTNLCLNELRRFEYQGKLEPLEGNPGPEGEPTRELPDEGAVTAHETLVGREAAGRIQAVLDRLPMSQKTALLLSRVEGFSYQEVADTLETSVSAVKSLIFRATQTLREELADELRALTDEPE